VLWGTLFPVLSEWVQGTKITVGPPFFNKVNVPIAMFLLLLTALGPLLAWHRTSLDSLKRNFLIPTIIAVCAAIGLIVGGMKPWQDIAYFYSLMAISLSVLVTATIFSEFWRGGRVIARHNNSNVFAGMVQLTRRNTRRYGGYIVHLGVVFAIIGFAGVAFNQTTEKELGFNDKMEIGPYTLVNRSYTQEDKPNYASNIAMIDVYKGDQKIDTMYPEQRFFKASEQNATIVANRSNWREDLYLVFAGTNPDTGRPIIKAHLNPLVFWIWFGAHVILIGTIIALVPNMQMARAPLTAKESAKAAAEIERTGTTVGAGD
jgi:cytochrome c-type biogenesis protein CcmF